MNNFSVNATQLLEATTFSATYNLGESYETQQVIAHPSQDRNLFYISCNSQNNNKIALLEYIEEANEINLVKEIQCENTIQNIIPCENNSNNQNQFYCVLNDHNKYKLVLCESEIENQSEKEEKLKVIQELNINEQKKILNVLQNKNLQENHIYLTDVNEVNIYDLKENKEIQSIYKNENSDILLSELDPHHTNLITNVMDNNDINVIDSRDKNTKFLIKDAHNLQILDIDFNPNKQYYFQTCSMDNLVKFWDMRKTNIAMKCMSDFANMPLSSKYNKFHDQLIVTSFNDGSLQLYKNTSISSVPQEMLSPVNISNPLAEDYQIKVYDEHEDSVYSVAWSNAKAWIFGSLSIQGNFIVNLVPSSEKYRILL